MLSESTISRYIDSVPALPKVLKACSKALDEGDLVHAADLAKTDSALIHYLKEIVNKPIFGFRGEVKDARQIFGILGLTRARQILFSYYVLLLVPKQWDVFDLNTKMFQDLQATLMIKWERILEHVHCEDEEIVKAVTLIPATVAVCESIFKAHIDTVQLIRERSPMTYEAILYKMSGYGFFDIAQIIAKKWELSETIAEFLKELGTQEEGKYQEYITYMKLLINFELSRPQFVQSGLNDFFDLYIDVSEETMEKFMTAMDER